MEEENNFVARVIQDFLIENEETQLKPSTLAICIEVYSDPSKDFGEHLPVLREQYSCFQGRGAKKVNDDFRYACKKIHTILKNQQNFRYTSVKKNNFKDVIRNHILPKFRGNLLINNDRDDSPITGEPQNRLSKLNKLNKIIDLLENGPEKNCHSEEPEIIDNIIERLTRIKEENYQSDRKNNSDWRGYLLDSNEGGDEDRADHSSHSSIDD